MEVFEGSNKNSAQNPSKLRLRVLFKSFPARLKATTRQEASRRDRAGFTKTEKDIGRHYT